MNIPDTDKPKKGRIADIHEILPTRDEHNRQRHDDDVQQNGTWFGRPKNLRI